MRLLTYQMPDELLAIAKQGEFDEFDLNEFFAATGTGAAADVQAQERRAEVARHHPRRLLRNAGRQPQARGEEAALPVLRRPAAAVPEPLVLVSAHRWPPATRWRTCSRRSRTSSSTSTRCSPWPAPGAGVGLAALPPVRDAIGNGHDTKTITPLVRKAHHRRHRPAVVVDPDAAQPQLAGDLLPGSVPGAVAVVDQESRTATTRTRRRSSSRSASSSTSRRPARCARSPTTAPASPRRRPTRRTPSRSS